MGLVVATRVWTMELTSAGRLVPWLGPAIRGALAWAVKDAVCRWPVRQRDTHYKTCRGCQHLQACPYGAAFWEPFRQRHRSNRRGQSYDLVGVSGGAVFGPVPLCLVPWLLWGGRLGVGEHRVCGAGCWQVTLLA